VFRYYYLLLVSDPIPSLFSLLLYFKENLGHLDTWDTWNPSTPLLYLFKENDNILGEVVCVGLGVGDLE